MRVLFSIVVLSFTVACSSIHHQAVVEHMPSERHVANADEVRFPFAQAERYGITSADVKNTSCVKMVETDHVIAVGTVEKAYVDPENGCQWRIECERYSGLGVEAGEINGLLTREAPHETDVDAKTCAAAAAAKSQGFCAASLVKDSSNSLSKCTDARK